MYIMHKYQYTDLFTISLDKVHGLVYNIDSERQKPFTKKYNIRKAVMIMANNEMKSMIKELKEYKLLKEEAEARIAELENALKAEMKAAETDKMTIDEYKLSLTKITTQRIDSKTLKEELPDIYNRYSKSSTYERFTVR